MWSTESERRNRPFHEDDGGFSTLGMVLALLISLSLIFTAAQVYRVNTASARVQDVADAAALAAENEVAEFMIVARVCDAIVLSLTLMSLTAFALGVVALCIPPASSAGEKLIDAGKSLLKARDSFANKAAKGLNTLQKALPFLAAANAAAVAQENGAGSKSSRYVALAILVPGEGKTLKVSDDEKTEDAGEEAEEQADEIEEAAEEAEEAAEAVNAAKEAAFERDCGDNPSYCLYERAKNLAGMSGSSNPYYSNVDAWSFQVPLKRAQEYYQQRLRNEQPNDSTVKEGARSALRKRFYRYAVSTVGEDGYVLDREGVFSANFPLLPRNLEEMRQTELFDQRVYPVTHSESGATVMHAWTGCPGAEESFGLRSLRELEEGAYLTCPECEFTVANMGSVASASTSIDNGFEYHYRKIAELAEDYEEAREKLDPAKEEVKEKVNDVFSTLRKAFKDAVNKRLNVRPPGCYGAVSLVVDVSSSSVSSGLGSSFVKGKNALGARVAVSGATLLAEDSSEGATVISSVLKGFEDQGNLPLGAANVLLGCWSSMLQAYTQGQEALTEGLKSGIDSIPLASESGLGSWAAGKLTKAIEDVGLQPAKIESLKPVLANTGNVTKSDSGSFSVNFRAVKERSAMLMSGSSDVFSSVLSNVEQSAVQALGKEYTFATIEPLGSFGPSIPLTVTLPEPLQHAGSDMVGSLIARLRGYVVEVTGVSSWE